MPFGMGKYDELCEYVKEQADAEIALLIVVEGKLGTSFSLRHQKSNARQALALLPAVLRHVAGSIEKDLKGGKGE